MSEHDDIDQTIAEYQEALREVPDFEGLHYSFGLALCKKGDLDNAIAEFREAIRLRPDFAEAHNSLARALSRRDGQEDPMDALREHREAFRLMGKALMEKGDLDGAIAIYRGALEADPEYAEAHYGLARALRRKDVTFLGEAIAEYRETLRLSPGHADASKALDKALLQRDLGWALPNTENLESAIAVARENCRLSPDDAEAHYALAKALRQQQGDKGTLDVEETIAEYSEALRLRPDFAEAHFGLGWALAMKGNLDGAVFEYRESLRLRPDLAYAHYFLGLVLQEKGDLDGSIIEYHAVLPMIPDDANAHYSLGWALRERGYFHLTEAIAEFQEAVRIRPDFFAAETAGHSTFMQRILGRPPLQPDEPKGSVLEYRERLRLDPEDAEAHYELAWALERKLDWEGATTEFTKALQLRADYAEARCSFGYILCVHCLLSRYNAEWITKAIAECRQAIRIKPGLAEAHYCLGLAIREKAAVKQDRAKACFVLTEEGKLEAGEAVTAFREAVRLRPDYAEAHFALGLALSLTEDLGGAIAAYREALRLHSDNPYWHVRLGWALNDTGDSAGAAVEYRETLRLDPTFPQNTMRIGA